MAKGLMQKARLFTSALLLTVSTNTPVFAEEINTNQTVILPSCLLEKTAIPFKFLGGQENLRLIQTNIDNLDQLSEDALGSSCGKFRNVTIEWNRLNTFNTHTSRANIILTNEITLLQKLNTSDDLSKTEKFKISHQKNVNELLTYFDSEKMWENLVSLTEFPNRYSRYDTGIAPAKWLKNEAEDMAKSANREDITTEFIKTGLFYPQPSLVVTIPGTDPNLEAVLVGAHMDTTFGDKPGADDDGSGSATALATMRAVLTSGVQFKRTIYFAWYAAEEQGLVGSGVVVEKFKDRKIALRGVLHFDMTGYQKTPANKIAVLDDHVDTELTKFIADLAQTYIKVEVEHTRCGYGCSDHASWTRKGFRAAAPLESKFDDMSPYLHLSSDTLETISAEHMGRFAKIGIAFLGELADPL